MSRAARYAARRWLRRAVLPLVRRACCVRLMRRRAVSCRLLKWSGSHRVLLRRRVGCPRRPRPWWLRPRNRRHRLLWRRLLLRLLLRRLLQLLLQLRPAAARRRLLKSACDAHGMRPPASARRPRWWWCSVAARMSSRVVTSPRMAGRVKSGPLARILCASTTRPRLPVRLRLRLRPRTHLRRPWPAMPWPAMRRPAISACLVRRRRPSQLQWHRQTWRRRSWRRQRWHLRLRRHDVKRPIAVRAWRTLPCLLRPLRPCAPPRPSIRLRVHRHHNQPRHRLRRVRRRRMLRRAVQDVSPSPRHRSLRSER